MILDGHQLGVIELVITDAAWGKLTEAQQECVRQAAAECAEFNREISEQGEQDALDALSDVATIVEVTDKTPWVEACAELIANSTKDYQELHQAIQDLK